MKNHSKVSGLGKPVDGSANLQERDHQRKRKFDITVKHTSGDVQQVL